jgi:hypothetical protein
MQSTIVSPVLAWFYKRLGKKIRMHWVVSPISYDPDNRTPIITTHVDSPTKPYK